jgi:hypothetical protein
MCYCEFAILCIVVTRTVLARASNFDWVFLQHSSAFQSERGMRHEYRVGLRNV